jgi:uncharacterized RDD family membrane protein YckC
MSNVPPPPPPGAPPPPPPPPLGGSYGSYGSYGGGAMVGAAAEWWQRALAIIIDIALVGVVAGLLAGSTVERTTVDKVTTFHFRWAALLLQLALWTLYAGLLNGISGQTLGKRALGIKVVRLTDQAPIGPGPGLLRAAVQALLGVLCGIVGIIDSLWPLWDAQKQALHDKVAGAIVVRAR